SVLVDETPVSPTEGGSGTVIGDAAGASPHDSDLNLGDSMELELELDDSDELSLDLEEGDLDPEDKTMFAEGGDEGLSASDLAALSLDLDDEDQIAPEDDTQFGAGGDDSGLAIDEVLNLDLGGGSSDDETQFAIGNEGFKVAEDELVLGGEENLLASAESSDVGLAAGNSGINIGSPHDSGISLEGGALDLAGASGSSLELPGADEEFMLGGSPEDEMSDSGSQVIALSDSVQFGEDSATMVQPDAGIPVADPLQGPADPFALPQDGGVVDPFAQPMGAATDPFAMPADAMAGAAPAVDPMQPQPEPEMVGADVLALPAVQETNYGFFNVFSLFIIFLMQVFILGMLIDLVKNLWGHHAETPTSLSKTTMDAAIGLK
ncbi:MAG: hypothetical protein NZ789_06065, partial [Pseudomonadales bacterium]|nr:hypothetical protein [Pseudomonadales bacterium]